MVYDTTEIVVLLDNVTVIAVEPLIGVCKFYCITKHSIIFI